jgi:two-component system sensor histidine kinase UhpB
VSLRLRLSLLFLGLFILGILSVLGRSIESARREVRYEIEAARVLTTLVGDLIVHERQSSGATAEEALPDFLQHLLEMEAELGFDVEVVPATEKFSQFDVVRTVPVRAPQWYVALLDIEEESLSREFMEFDGSTIMVNLDPGDAINQTWVEVQQTLLTRTIGLLLFYLLSNVIIGIWLRTTSQIVFALDDIVKGDFSRRVPHLSLPELDQIARKINHLVGVVGVSKADNERLTRQALTAQEQERRYFAQELHDSLGQSVSAIKAMAVSIAMRARDGDPVIAESASKIEKISDSAYSSVHDMMAWLRPAVLDELGLTHALHHMVDEWNEHHEDTFCRMRMEGNFDQLQEEQKINIYRIVQEALTNAAKYAQADTVTITLGGQEIISLIISDNGKGFDQDKVVLGMGLSGIRDRVNMLQGSITISSRPGKGTSLHMEFPRVTGYRRRLSDRISL